MTFRGRISKGVVVLDGDVHLEDGTLVTVEPITTKETPSSEALYHLTDLAVPTGVPDLAQNVDHYLYGHPKANDANQ